jgi:Domain of unknown function (DUF4157)
VYRSALAAPPVTSPRPAAAEPGSYTRPLPSDLAATFGALTGLDVSGIPVHRGPGVSAQARAYQARAFTRAGEIFLPDEAGPLEHSDARALLAHELTHALQQRILSPSLPDETSPAGRDLEDEASHAGQWYRSGGNGAPHRLAHLPVGLLLAGHADHPLTGPGGPAPGYAWPVPAGTAVPAEATASAVTGGVQRQPGSPWPTAMPGTTALQATGPAEAVTAGPGSDGTAAGDVAVPVIDLPGLAADGLPALPALPGPGGGVAREEMAGLIENASRLAELSAMRPADLDDPVSLDELASRVYPRLRGLLRGELLIDRERSGLLADPS